MPKIGKLKINFSSRPSDDNFTSGAAMSAEISLEKRWEYSFVRFPCGLPLRSPLPYSKNFKDRPSITTHKFFIKDQEHF